jgi:hypothetical protein
MVGAMAIRRFVALLIAVSVALIAISSSADDAHCDGPDACCPSKLASTLDSKTSVSIGIVVMGLSNIDEREGTWAADYYLYESWLQTPNFTPQTEIVNEVERKSVAFDTIDLTDTRCTRSRRIHSILRTEFNLRRFPFDRQQLVLQSSDDRFVSREVGYANTPYVLGLDPSVRAMVSGWKIDGDPTFDVEPKVFALERGSPTYDYATVRIPVRRHVSFHFTRYFLPLLIIVAVSFVVFWIDPEELNSALSVGVTCLLASIALQFSEVGTLPEVSYLTLADRIYVVCYVAIAATIVEVVATNALCRRGRKEFALRIDRICRRGFPAALLVAIFLSAVRAFTQD